MTRGELLRHLKESTKVLKTKEIEEAFKNIDRADFVKDDYRAEAYEDYPLPIGYGQTISQPSTVAFMLELLEPKVGDKILDLGSGSGWTTALLAQIVGEKGKVIGLERIPELVEYGQVNLAKYNFRQARIEKADTRLGVPKDAPFCKILVSASTEELPKGLIKQLKTGGVLVIPVGNSILRVDRTETGILQKSYEGFVFVPLIT